MGGEESGHVGTLNKVQVCDESEWVSGVVKIIIIKMADVTYLMLLGSAAAAHCNHRTPMSYRVGAL